MKAAVVGPEGLRVSEVETPRPAPEEILVRVRAASLNRADLGVAAGQQHGTIGGAGTIPGLEWAGEVAEVGAEARGFRVGDRVMCTGAGGYADYAVCDAGRACVIPSGMSFETATTLPIALQTMHDALITNARLEPGESVLVQGASSGVGIMALQIARWRGAQVVIGTSTNPERREKLKAFGATVALDSREAAWPEQVREATGGKGVDVVIDQVSGALMNGNLQAAAVLGRIVNVGRLGGNRGEIDFDLHASKRIRYIGVTNRTRSIAELRAITAKVRADLWAGVEANTFSLPIDSRFKLDAVIDALAHMRKNQHMGKIILLM
ncbi:quinone oxidoreductase family protein [Methylobacterium trifolii]|uniref:Mycocerosic acid synthase n=1 Tax=Methylobacterium trifolii TaxID=1003092 RepID=A0ABQ4U3N2_9HYPH|nr:zinc-binding dehydrogenase [Methylobacterium trifolii]GJE60923.1 Mycocerosic acid synthase [Methylobacterium trifolii]